MVNKVVEDEFDVDVVAKIVVVVVVDIGLNCSWYVTVGFVVVSAFVCNR